MLSFLETRGGLMECRVVDSLREAERYLAGRGVEEPRLNSELLLSHSLGLGRTELLLNPFLPIAADALRGFRESLLRRGSGEPIQYITGKLEWLNFQIRLTRGVFVPRPETETMVEAVVELPEKRGFSVCLDVGTGCGNIAISLARLIPGAHIYASDVSFEALLMARENARSDGLSRRVSFINGDLLEPFRRDAGIDLIVSNPPYIRSGDLSLLPTEVRSWEPRLSLDGGEDGLQVIRRLIQDSRSMLKRGGMLVLEIGEDQAREVCGLAGRLYDHVDVGRDLDGRQRFVIVKR